MKINRKILFILLIALLFITIFNVKVYATETGFAFDKETLDVRLNGSGWISWSGGSGTITWESSDTTVATVENGTVKGLKIGSATITATRGEETATCKVNVVYDSLRIGGNEGASVSSVNLILNEHGTEKLYATVKDYKSETVENVDVKWSSSDTSVVTVDKGNITAIKPGTAIITAEAAGVSDTCEVTVYSAPVFTDFSKANYELLFDYNVDLKITGVTPNEDNGYYYIITSTNTKPTVKYTSWGGFDSSNVSDCDSLLVNTEENYMYDRNLDKYVELNQDLYLWIIEDVNLGADFALSEENNYISHATKFVVEGKKLTRPELPQLNLILKSMSIWGGQNSANTEEYTGITFRFPSAVENRKFKLKIGKVTDNSILQKIQNNDYSGITSLLAYAKNNNAVYSADLATTSVGYFRSDAALFDGLTLLEDRAYYYIYVEFDDENGKYMPIEGVTLGQAWIANSREYWDLWAYTADNFEWNNLSTTPTETEKKEEPDDTVASGKLPNAGSQTFIIVSVILLVATTSIVCYKKYNWFRDIK